VRWQRRPGRQEDDVSIRNVRLAALAGIGGDGGIGGVGVVAALGPRLRAVAGLALLSSVGLAFQVEPQWNIVKPSSTGIPGEELRVMVFDPQGNLWVAGRWPFWFESGVARLSADQVPYQPLSGGGFDTGRWEVWSSIHYPIPSAFINDIEFGAGGAVWFGSDGGLTRFEPDAPDPAATFTTFNAANSPLVADGIRSLDMDATGRLWMVNGDVNFSPSVFSFDPATGAWRRFDMGEELPWGSSFALVNALHVGVSGHVWVTHASLPGLAEFDGVAWTLHAGGAQFDAPLEDLAGNVWLTTGNAGLWKWNGSSFQNWPVLGGTATIAGLDVDPAGLVYVSTWHGPTYRMLGGATPSLFVNASALPYHIEPRPNGEVWIGNYGGNGVSGTARHYTADGALLERINTWNSGLPDYFVDDIFTDLAGNLWFATGEAGITRMLGSDGAKDQPTSWRNWGDHNDLSEPYPWAGNEPMRCMLDDGNGVIWMAGNGVGRWREATGSFTGFWNWQTSALSTDLINELARDGNGDLWAASDGSGVWRFNGEDWEHHGFSNPYSYSQERILALATDHDGVLWVGAEYGLHTFDGTTWKALHLDGSLPFNAFSVNDIEVGPDGDVWVATIERLARWNGVSWTQYTPANSGLLEASVQSISIRGDGLVAVASFDAQTFPYNGGVSLFDGQTWTSYTPANSPLTHFQVEAVRFDADGDLWVSAMSEGVNEILLGGSAPPWTTYCTAKVNSAGCTPSMSATGEPSASAGIGFVVRAAQVLPGKPGLLLYSKSGPGGAPFQGGFLCASSPIVRTALQVAGNAGAPPCTGTFAFDFNAYVASGADPGLTQGQAAWCQYWSRDPSAVAGSGLTNGLTFVLGP
jgi:ligand-binding sensor domain-containing protein